MGRGRAKAKQTKVARELKYSSHEPDYDKLQQELSDSQPSVRPSDEDGDDDADDGYGPWRGSSG